MSHQLLVVWIIKRPKSSQSRTRFIRYAVKNTSSKPAIRTGEKIV